MALERSDWGTSPLALEPSLWRTLPEEVLHLVFARLPVAGIGCLRVLSKEWKRNIDCKHSEFNRVFDTTTRLQKFALLCSEECGDTFVSLYDVRDDLEENDWHYFDTKTDYLPALKTSTADGGLFCCPRKRSLNDDWHLQIVVVNPLTQRKRKLPPLLSTGAGGSDVGVKMVQLTMDRKTKEYKLHVVGYMKTGGNGLFAQVYDSHIHGWSVVEPREGRIIGWEHSTLVKNCLFPIRPCVYNCADGSVIYFNSSDIAPGLMVYSDCFELVNDHLFVFHKEIPPGSTYLPDDDDSALIRFCISEFHLPEKATAWVKLRVHECDPSIYDYPDPDYEWALLSCNGFLLVRIEDGPSSDSSYAWLYNLSTSVWCKLPDLALLGSCDMMLCEINWSALP